jgi:hypothetical protein
MKAIRKREKVGARGTIHSGSIKKHSDGTEESLPEVSKEFTEKVDHPNPAYVGVDGGLTKNLGNFESARISVSVTMPCAPTEAAIRKAYDKASALVDEFMDLEYKKAVGDDASAD